MLNKYRLIYRDKVMSHDVTYPFVGLAIKVQLFTRKKNIATNRNLIHFLYVLALLLQPKSHFKIMG